MKNSDSVKDKICIKKYDRSNQINDNRNNESLFMRLKDFDIIIEDSYNDKDNMLLNLFKSILCVEDKYILYTDKETDKLQKHTERVFAYELYRQWSNRIHVIHNDSFIINGEIGKTANLFNHFSSLGHKFPDMVLHQSHENCDYQGIVCEIKTSNITKHSFKEDIEKLCCFVCGDDEKHRFNFGVFILVGEDIQRIFKIMDEIDLDVFVAKVKKRMERIICVAYNHGWLQTTRLDWLINNRKELKESLDV